MTPLNPVTAVSYDLAQALADEIVAAHSSYWGGAPLSFVALDVRMFLRFCEDNAIVQPTDQSVIVRAVFAPSFGCLSVSDRDYVINILTNLRAAPEARARAIALALQ